MNKSDVFEIIENVVLILGGAVIVNAILNIGKKEDTNAEVKKMNTNAIKKAYIQCIKMLGQIIYESVITNNSSTIDLSNLKNGQYLLRVNYNKLSKVFNIRKM